VRYKLKADRAQLRLFRSCLVTTGLIVRQLCSLWTPGSICTWFCSYNSACINIFIHRSRRRD